MKSLFDTILIFALLLQPLVAFGADERLSDFDQAIQELNKKATEFNKSQEALVLETERIQKDIDKSKKRLQGIEVPDPQDKNKSFKAAIEVTSDKELLKFMPSKLAEELAVSLVDGTVETSKTSWRITKSAGKSIAMTTKHFPAESSVFFIAMGGVMTAQLAFWYAENPLAMEQHLSSLFDPIAHISFYSFMVANGLVSNSLSTFAGSKTMRHFIPYMGMSAGLMVSSVFGELLADPEFQECAGYRIRKNQKGPVLVTDKKEYGFQPKMEKVCDSVYKRWVLSKKINQYLPALLSMIASTAAGAGIQAGLACLRGACGKKIIENSAQAVGSRALLWRGLTLGIRVIPGVGWGLTGGAMIYKMVNFASFLVLDQWVFHPLMRWPYGNIIEGKRPNNNAVALANTMLSLKNKNWNADVPRLCKNAETQECQDNLVYRIEEFSESMAKWREFNLEKPMMKHHHWTQMLANLTGNYTAALRFYNDFLVSNEARFTKNPNRPNAISPLERQYPLWGVQFPGDLNPVALLDNPDAVERGQAITIAILTKYIDAATGYKPNQGEDGQELATKQPQPKLDADFIAALLKIRHRLNASIMTMQKIGEAVADLNKLVQLSYQKNWTGLTDKTREIIANIRKILNQPDQIANPLLVPGVGFLASYEFLPKSRQLHGSINFTTMINGFSTPALTDHFIYQMVCGKSPDRGEKLITQLAKGFSFRFSFPRIAKPLGDLKANEKGASAQDFFCKDFAATEPVKGNFYNREIYSVDGKQKLYVGLLDYLKKNVDPKFIDKSPTPGYAEPYIKQNEVFQTWWNSFVQKELKETVEQMSNIYQSEVAPGMLTALRDQKDSDLNKNTLANSVLKSARTELKLYLILLGEMIKDLYKIQKNQVPAFLYVSNEENLQNNEQLKNVDRRGWIQKTLNSGAFQAIPVMGPLISSTNSLINSGEFDLLGEVAEQNSYSLNQLLLLSEDKKKTLKDVGHDPALAFQSEIMLSYDKLTKLFSKFEIQQQGDQKRLTGKISQKEFEEIEQSATEILESAMQVMDFDEKKLATAMANRYRSSPEEIAAEFEEQDEVKDENKIPKEQRLHLSVAQMEIADKLKNNILAIFGEMSMYGQALTAINWDKMQHNEKQTVGKCVRSSMMSNPLAASACPPGSQAQ